jgi:hypothetical protein
LPRGFVSSNDGASFSVLAFLHLFLALICLHVQLLEAMLPSSLATMARGAAPDKRFPPFFNTARPICYTILPLYTVDLRSSGGRASGLIACMSIVSQAFPNWQLGARSSQAAIDALYFITTIQQQQFPGIKTFVYAQGLATLVANQMASAFASATWPGAKKAQIDGWILDSVRRPPIRHRLAHLGSHQPPQVAHPSDDASKFLFGTDTVGHMLMASCSAPMCPESISDYFGSSDPNSRYPQSTYQAALDT